MQEAQAVEHCQGVHHHVAHRTRLERAELPAKADLDRRFGNLRAAPVCDGQKLKVEGVRLDQHTVERLAEQTALEEFHARLGVRYGQADEQSNQAEVDDARKTAMPRILHVRFRMALRADNYVAAVRTHRLEELRQHLGCYVEIAVKEQHVSASRSAEADLERIPLPGVLLDPNRPYHVRALCCRSPQCVGGAVAAPVVNGNKLVAEVSLVKA